MKPSCCCLNSIQFRTDTFHRNFGVNIIRYCKSHPLSKRSDFTNMLYVILRKKNFAIHLIFIILSLAFLLKEMIIHIFPFHLCISSKYFLVYFLVDLHFFVVYSCFGLYIILVFTYRLCF